MKATTRLLRPFGTSLPPPALGDLTHSILTDSEMGYNVLRKLAMTPRLRLIGCVNGAAGRHLGCEKAVSKMQESRLLKESQLECHWSDIIKEEGTHRRQLRALPGLAKLSKELAHATQRAIESSEEFAVIGGDHSCAIGTWSGIARAMVARGHIGLLWVDAHLDAHTPTSSHTGNLHGTPVAHLSGCGDARLSDIFGISPKIRPQNLAVVGARSFEPEEAELVHRLKIPVFHESEIKKRGLQAVLDDAFEAVNDGTCGYGMSIDLDGFREVDAPAVGTPEDGGVVAADFIDYLMTRVDFSRHIATEIVEFLPHKDDENRTTEKLIATLLESIYLTKYVQLNEQLTSGHRLRRI